MHMQFPGGFGSMTLGPMTLGHSFLSVFQDFGSILLLGVGIGSHLADPRLIMNLLKEPFVAGVSFLSMSNGIYTLYVYIYIYIYIRHRAV